MFQGHRVFSVRQGMASPGREASFPLVFLSVRKLCAVVSLPCRPGGMFFAGPYFLFA